MSMVKRWNLCASLDEKTRKQFPEFHPVILQLLFNRGLCEKKTINTFLYPDFDRHLYDPGIFCDMTKACDRIITALEKNEKILVYGDYDADGVSSSVLMVSSLQALGGDVSVYIPHRELEGYGLNETNTNYIIEQKYNLVITVDCAISNKNEIKTLQDTGIDVIVTDHHTEPLDLPAAHALINPQLSRESYPFKKLAGVGVAFKVIQGLMSRLTERKIFLNKDFFETCGGYQGYIKWLLDLVSIGTVADCMPLLDENRLFVKYGLLVLQKSQRLGIRELLNHAGVSGKDIQTYHIGFQLAPRINAAGRLDHANVAYELLMSKDPVRACELSNQLNDTNIERQNITERILQEIKSKFTAASGNNLVCVLGDDWLAGIVGLVAGKLVEYFNKPVIVMTKSKGLITGSGRSLSSFNMIDALQKLDKYLKAYGGHKMACGFTLKDNSLYDSFIKEFDSIAGDFLKGKDLTPIVSVDMEIALNEITWEIIKELELFEPFGYGNTEPTFLIKGARVVEFMILGRQDKHMRFSFEQDGTTRKAIAFGFGDVWGNQIRVGDLLDLVCNVGINEWNGNREIQLKVVDMKFVS